MATTAQPVPVHKTAFGKTFLHILLIAVAYGLTYLITYFGNIHWPNSMPLYLPGLILAAVGGLRNFVDKELPNFPTSTQLVAIPKEVAEALHLVTVANTDVLPTVDKLLPQNPTTAKIEKDVAQVGKEAQAALTIADKAVATPAATLPTPGTVVSQNTSPTVALDTKQ
jgi:hypothetical protein